MVNGTTSMEVVTLQQMNGVVVAGSAVTVHGVIHTWVHGTLTALDGGSVMRAAGMHIHHGDGYMATNETIDGYYVDASGACK